MRQCDLLTLCQANLDTNLYSNDLPHRQGAFFPSSRPSMEIALSTPLVNTAHHACVHTHTHTHRCLSHTSPSHTSHQSLPVCRFSALQYLPRSRPEALTTRMAGATVTPSNNKLWGERCSGWYTINISTTHSRTRAIGNSNIPLHTPDHPPTALRTNSSSYTTYALGKASTKIPRG